MILIVFFLSGIGEAMGAAEGPCEDTSSFSTFLTDLDEFVLGNASPIISISGELEEDELVSISCSTVTPCSVGPPKLMWNHPWDAENSTEQNADWRTIRTTSQVNITLSDEHDGSNVTCSASYPVGGGARTRTAEETVTLNVNYSPKDTVVSVSPSDPVSVGSLVDLSCSSRSNPPVSRFEWIMITSGRMEFSDHRGPVYSFTVTDSDLDRRYFCVAINVVGSQISTGVQLTFHGDELVGVQVLVKILGILVLISTMIVFEWWFRSKHPTKPVKDTLALDYINMVIE